MSAIIFANDTLFLQRLLACEGLYKGKLDDWWGPKTEAAYKAHVATYEAIKTELGEFDVRSESYIKTLLPAAQRKVRSFMHLVAGRKLVCKVISGTRTYAEQTQLYNERPRVTKASAGQSNHNFGIAWDIGLWDGARYLTGGEENRATARASERAYVDVGALVKSHLPGVEWGGDWSSFPDQPHFQLKTGLSTSAVRAAFEAGRAFV